MNSILKLILIGFFIGKGIDETISELTKKRDLILKNISEHCTDSIGLVRRRIEEIETSSTYLIYVDKEQCVATIRSLEADLTFWMKTKSWSQNSSLQERKSLRDFVDSF